MKCNRGDVFFVNLKTDTGSVQKDRRPVVIISNDTGNRFSNTCVCAMVTTKNKNSLPTHVDVLIKAFRNYGNTNSVVELEQIRTVDKSLLTEKLGKLNEDEIKKVDEAILISMGIK